MTAFAVPLPAEKLDAWKSWTEQLKGSRKAEFDDMNARLGITEHRAYLQPTPDGSFLVVAVHEGPGGDDFLAKVTASGHDFDRWFVGSIADFHGIDPSGPLPPTPTRYV